MTRKLAGHVAGSALSFDHDGRPATASVNFVTAHDGFTLMDTVSYSEKHNAANGEEGRDGHDANHSDNCGHEGPTEDAEILARRARRRRNMLATVMFSQGTPMILAGDELGNSQGGNNNAYCQDNAIGWVDWEAADPDFLAFVRRIIAFRKANPILRQKRFLHAGTRAVDGKPDVFWRRADGRAMHEDDWCDPDLRCLGVEMRMARGTPAYEPRYGAVYLLFNAGGPDPRGAARGPAGASLAARHRHLRPVAGPADQGGERIAEDSVVAFELAPVTESAARSRPQHAGRARA